MTAGVPERYRIVREIGEGQSARVYEAMDEQSGRNVALKLMREELVQDATARLRFHREARALMSIEHPNVISLYDYSGKDAASQFIVSELLAGQSLMRLVDTRGPMPEAVAVAVFVQVLRGLAAAHAAQLVHRDFSLANIFVEASGRAVVMDLGLAAGRENTRETFATRAASIVGTPMYIAPEIFTHNAYSQASDLYAVGISLTYALLGRPPFAANDMGALLGAILDGRLTRATAEYPTSVLAALADRLTSREPAQRGASAEHVGQELQDLLGADADARAIVARWFTGNAPLVDAGDAALDALSAGDLDRALTLSLGERYQLGEMLGEGGMGRVYRARDRLLKRDVAVKLLLLPGEDERASFAEARLRFHREARAAGRLRHANIASLLAYSGRDAAVPYLIFELITGATLEAILAIEPVGEDAALVVVAALADALAHAHENGIVHRDVKPANVFVDETGRVILCDFGIALGLREGPQEHTLAKKAETRAIGTPPFSSPEQVFDPQQVGPASDVFSLGSLLYALVTGRSPFADDSFTATLRRLRDVAAAPLPRAASLEFAALIQTMHQLQPAQRHSALEVKRRAEELLVARRIFDGRAFLRQRLGMERGTALYHTGKEAPRMPPPAKRVRLVALLAIAAVASGLVLTAALTLGRSDLPPSTTSAPSPVAPGLPEPLPVADTPPALHTEPQPPPVPVKPEPQRAQPALVRFITKPWAKVVVDGKTFGSTPLFISTELAPGRHVIRFENPNYPVVERILELKAGESRDVRVSLAEAR